MRPEVAVAILLGVIPQVDYLALQLEVVFIRPFFKFFEVLYMQFRQLVVGDFALSYEIIDDMQKNLLRTSKPSCTALWTKAG